MVGNGSWTGKRRSQGRWREWGGAVGCYSVCNVASTATVGNAKKDPDPESPDMIPV